MPAPENKSRSPFGLWSAILALGYISIVVSSFAGNWLGMPLASYYIAGTYGILVLGGGLLMLGWLFLFAPEMGIRESTKQSQQFSISDVLILTSVLALEVAAAAQNNILLFCLFITVIISVLALVWKRTLLRRVLVISTVLIWILAVVFAS